MTPLQSFDQWLNLGWTLALTLIAAFPLVSIGFHQTLRNMSTQTLCLSQGAYLGATFGAGLGWLGSELGVAGFFGALLGYGLSFGAMLIPGTPKNTFHLALFALLLALTFSISDLFPQMPDSSALDFFFRSIDQLSLKEKLVAAVILTLSSAILAAGHSRFSNRSFERAALGRSSHYSRSRGDQLTFLLIQFFTLGTAIQFLGLLMTLILLFIPTILAGMIKWSRAKHHFIAANVIAIFGILVSYGLCQVLDSSQTVAWSGPGMFIVFILGGFCVLLYRRLQSFSPVVAGTILLSQTLIAPPSKAAFQEIAPWIERVWTQDSEPFLEIHIEAQIPDSCFKLNDYVIEPRDKWTEVIIRYRKRVQDSSCTGLPQSIKEKIGLIDPKRESSQEIRVLDHRGWIRYTLPELAPSSATP